MIAVMSPPFTAGTPDWRPGHSPQLSYRDQLPSDEHIPTGNPEIGVVFDEKARAVGRSIKEIREATLRETTVTSSIVQPRSPIVQLEKEKKSIWQKLSIGTEPSKKAFNDMRQKELAKHGGLSPSNYANVSTQMMPGHVPKVNSKWDGIPDAVRQRERQEREKARSALRGSLRPVNSRSRSSEQDVHMEFHRRGSTSASIAESWDSYSTDSRPPFYDDMSMRPGSIYSNSSVTSASQSQQTTPVLSQPYVTIPSPQSSDMISYCTGDASLPPDGPQRWHSSQSVLTQSTASSDRSRPDCSPRIKPPSIQTTSKYAPSSATTTPECSPQPPSVFPDGAGMSVSRQKSIRPSINRRTSDNKSTNASRRESRTGLGLQTHNLVAPWESQVLPSENSLSPMSSLSSPRGRKGFFGREKK